MHRPDYRNSIVNLTASLAAALGAETPHPSLPALPPAALADAHRLLLLVVDGLGHDFLLRRGGALREHLQGRLSSVFPTTTASAVPVIFTGLAPRQHALTGWHMYSREIGSMVTTLPFTLRAGQQPLATAGLTPQQLYGLPPLADRLRAPVHVVAPAWIVNSPFNVALAGRATRHGYQHLDEMVATLVRLLQGDGEPCFIHAYWPDLDSLAHAHGIASPQVEAAFVALDTAFAALLAVARRTRSTVIVTADHGFTDTGPEDTVDLADHPELRRALLMPLSGEPRVAYAYVRAGWEARFESYVTERLAEKVELRRSADLIEQGWFGPGTTHPALADRIGDYTLIGRGATILRDWLPGEKPYRHVGVHGGLSDAELYVPLVLAAPS